MTQKSCCKCQSTITIQSSTSRHSTWCRQCFIDQLHIKFFQAFKVAKDYCRPPNPKNQIHSQGLSNPSFSSSLAIHFENNLNSFVTLHLINNYLKTNHVRSTDKWKSPIDFDSIQVVWVNPGSASKYLSTDPSILHSKSKKTNKEEEEEEQNMIKLIVESLGFKLVILNLDDLFSQSTSAALLSSTPSNPSPPASRYFVDLSDPNLPILKIDSAAENSRVVRNQKPIPNEGEESTSSVGAHTETNLQKILTPLSKTSQNTLIEILTTITLLNFCKQTPSTSSSLISKKKEFMMNKKVLVKSTSSTRLAIDTLLNVSLGNGFCLDQIVGPTSFIDDVLICRPIYQILDVELIEYTKFLQLTHHYNSFNLDQNLHSFHDTPTADSVKKNDNIHFLITGFIKKLEENYPMTSSVINQTVNKIGNKKLEIKNSFSSSPSTCRICFRGLDSEAKQWKRAITLSAHESIKKTNRTEGEKSTQQVEIQREALDESRDIEEEGYSLRDNICFACLVTFTDHLYAFNPPHSATKPDWIQLPIYFNLDHPQPPSSHTDHLHEVLDEFLLKD